MKKKILIIVSVIAVVFAIILGIIIHKNMVKPMVTWNGSVGDWTDHYRLEIQIYNNGNCKLIGQGMGTEQTVSFKIDKSKINELRQKIDELKFENISEHISIVALDYPSSSITVNYENGKSHRVGESAGIKGGNGEQWEIENYSELSKEIWSLIPKDKQNKLENKIDKYAGPLINMILMRGGIVFGILIIIVIILVYFVKRRKN